MAWVRPGSSGTSNRGDNETSSITDNPVLKAALSLGPVGDTYKEEFDKLKSLITRETDIVGPAAPVIVVDLVRKLYSQAISITGNPQLEPYEKCVNLFHTFDAIVLAYKSLSFVYSDRRGAESIYGYSELALKSLLSRIEAIARQVAVAVHDTYSLTVLNNVVSSAKQRLSQVQTEKDMLEFFRTVSGAPDNTVSATDGQRLPHGIEVYNDPYPDADGLLLLLHEECQRKYYVRDFYDAMYLIAVANSPSTLSNALETRLANKDRNVVLLQVPGDRVFATSLCASAIAFLRKRVQGKGDTSSTPGTTGSEEIETYRINYGRIFSKFRGESERNFDTMMEWIKNSVRAGDKFRVFWFPDIENLMSPRTSNDQEHIVTIKNAMLQHMDAFNKDPSLRSFMILFNSSEGPLDSAFARRIETTVTTPSNPLTDLTVATQSVNAMIVRYRINLTFDLAEDIAKRAGVVEKEKDGGRIGGLAYVQATLRDLYVNQKLVLRYNASRAEMKEVRKLNVMEEDNDITYDLDERDILLSNVRYVAFTPTSRLASDLSKQGLVKSMSYNSDIPGDPKNINKETASQTIFLHHV